jgi:hypothetical protein
MQVRPILIKAPRDYHHPEIAGDGFGLSLWSADWFTKAGLSLRKSPRPVVVG